MGSLDPAMGSHDPISTSQDALAGIDALIQGVDESGVVDESGAITRVAAAFGDLGHQDLAPVLLQRDESPSVPVASSGVHRVVATGRPELRPRVDPQELGAVFQLLGLTADDAVSEAFQRSARAQASSSRRDRTQRSWEPSRRLNKQRCRVELVGLLLCLAVGLGTAWWAGSRVSVDLTSLKTVPESFGFVRSGYPLRPLVGYDSETTLAPAETSQLLASR
jgi:hypothetical protein